ncbi:hypothetical protein [Pontimicrobium aquaticum]|uniref:Uncharacterized protein n=1 Tax=Pontimicrobium aquaticum TaxID=2565367 RepID=A0A4V5LR37_9FLAO|nr:hypothetical protein [Pontimicrobium aquaticum]TJY37249.1 hypothetical protein E5167_04680 [Pontimicrobium aquaticum]
MNKKWYIIGFVVILAFLSGVVTQQHISKPNQEIVLYFTNNTINYDEVEDAISGIKSQLEAVGVSNIKVTRFDNDGFNITYHSISKVSDIEQILLNSGKISLNEEHSSRVPTEESKTSFNFDVYEIETVSDNDLNIRGIGTSSSSKGDYKQNLETNSFANKVSSTFAYHKQNETTTYKFYNQNRFVFSCNSHKIPEVRAGPYILG